MRLPLADAAAGPAALLRERGFVGLLGGHLLSALAPAVQRTAFLLWVYALTDSGAAVGLIGLAEALARLTVAPVAGVLVDRWSRARTMAGVVLAQAGLLLPLFAVRDASGLPLLLGVTLAVNAAGQFYGPAATAALPAVVGRQQVGPANGLLQGTTSLVSVVAPGVAAGAFATAGPHVLVAALVVTYLAGAPLLAAVPAPRPVRPAGGVPADSNSQAGLWRPLLAQLLTGAQHVAQSPTLLALTAVALTATLGTSALGVLDVVFVTRGLGLPPGRAAGLLTATGAGHLAGAVAVTLLGRRLTGRYHLLLGVAVGAEGLAVLAYAVAPTLAAATAACFVLGVLYLVAGVSFVTLVQLATEDGYLGRVTGLINAGMAAAAVLSTGAGGALADHHGVRRVFGATAVLLLAAGGLSLLLVRRTPALAGRGDSCDAALAVAGLRRWRTLEGKEASTHHGGDGDAPPAAPACR